MARWNLEDVAEFTHDPNPNTTTIGEVRCLLCHWVVEPTSPYILPTIDDAVERHMNEAHAEKLNSAGVQRAPVDDKLVYYVITNP